MNKTLKQMRYLIIFISLITISCNQRKCLPIDTSLCVLLRIPGDSLELSFFDSYYRIRDYKTYPQNDTLYIDIKSVEHFHSIKEITMHVDTNIHVVNLNDEIIINIDSIPWKRNVKVRGFGVDGSVIEL